MKTSKLSLQSMLFLFPVFFCLAVYAQITPSRDAYTSSATPTTNFGTATTLGVVNSTTSIQTTYIQFDLSSIPSDYTGANVAKATLKLYVSTVTTAGSFNVDFVNGSWAEKTLTANTAPALGTTIAASVPLTSDLVHNYVLVDVTEAVQAWLNGTQANDGLALVANSPLSATFDSKESLSQSQPAELDIVFTGNIAGVTTASGSGLTGGGTSGTLNLSLTTACAANQILQWNGSGWVCSNAGTGTITGVTAGTDLTGGGTRGTVTLNVDTTKVVTAVAAGTGLTGGGTGGVQTLNVDTTKVPLLATANAFTGAQTVNGNLSATGAISGQTGSFSGNNSTQILSAVNAGSGAAMLGNSTNFSSGFGVEGISSSLSAGVYGIGPNRGVLGSAPHTGVEGDASAVGGSGVLGVATCGTFTCYGVEGNATSTTASGVGVYDVAYGRFGTGVEGDAASTGIGVLGSTGIGVLGVANNPGSIAGQFNNFAGGIILQGFGTGGGAPKFVVDGSGNVTASGNVMATNGSFNNNLQAITIEASTGSFSSTEAGTLLHVGGNNINSPTTAQGAYLDWNALNASTGETDFINNQGLGPGGFAFMNTSGGPRSTLMFITGSGKVGINNTNPTTTLDVAGSVKINGDTPMSSNPRMTFSGMFPGSFCDATNCGFLGGPGGFFVPDKDIVITRVTIALASTADSSCDGPTIKIAGVPAWPGLSLNGAGNYVDSGTLSLAVSAGTTLIITYVGGINCNSGTSGGGNAFVNVQYLMQ